MCVLFTGKFRNEDPHDVVWVWFQLVIPSLVFGTMGRLDEPSTSYQLVIVVGHMPPILVMPTADDYLRNSGSWVSSNRLAETAADVGIKKFSMS